MQQKKFVEPLLKVIFLGGVGEIGKNMTALEFGEDIIIIDCGSTFPTSDTPLLPNFFGLIKVSVETYPIIWIAVAAGLLLLILLLILILIIVKRRKRKREELEAILISEMELEEQMLRIANTSAAAYQSYGFLPPTVNVQNDPSMMLGAGSAAPTPDTVALNPGQQGNNGVPNDSDM